jgi:type IV pilus assembly protein PilC
MKYNYQARTRDGKVQTGVVEASTREAAFNVLKTHDLYVTALQESIDLPFYAKQMSLFAKANKKDVVLFSRQVSIMLKSNVPIVESFRTIAKQSRKADLREKILKIAEGIEGGDPLSKALAQHPKLFTSFYINMVKAGEASGKLSDVFLYLADYLERQDQFNSKIKGAMIYPIFVLVVFVGVVTLIMGYVIPSLSEVLEASGADLPAITKVVISSSYFIKNEWWLLILIIGGLAGGFVYFSRSKRGKELIDRSLIRMPVLKTFLKKFYLSRIATNLSTLISGGLPIASALQITGDVVGSFTYREILYETRDGVKRGEAISSVLDRYPDYISPLFYQMIMVGEKTGTLDTSLENVVSFYQRDIDRSLDSFIRLLEPLFIVILGGVVAGLMGAVLLPIYSGGMLEGGM